MTDLDAYDRFLRAKAAVAPRTGVQVAPAEISAVLKPHQRACVQWMVDGGRRALFAAFGLGKSVAQISKATGVPFGTVRRWVYDQKENAA